MHFCTPYTCQAEIHIYTNIGLTFNLISIHECHVTKDFKIRNNKQIYGYT
uniref:Uncharacterized protein n=1 Tax=Anguilla anguilla TaxID=7936 RepID=A0A0E9UWM8_ANGAN